MQNAARRDDVAELRHEVQDLKRKLAEQERVNARHTQLIEAIEALPDGLALFDPGERLVLCNAKYRELHPTISHTMVTGANIEDIAQAAARSGQYDEIDGPPEDWVDRRLDAFRNPGAPIEQKFADGSWRRVYERKTAEGYTVAVRIDITEQKERERRQNLSDDRLQDCLDASSDWFWEMDSECRFSYFSESFERHTGVPPETLLGKTREETGIPDVDPKLWAAHLDTLAAHRSFRDFRHPRKMPNGETVHLSISAKAIFAADGQFVGYRGVGRDITDQVVAEDRAHSAETLLANAVEDLSDAFVLWDSEHRLVLCNKAFRALNAPIAAELEPGTTSETYFRLAVEKGLFPVHAGQEAWIADRLDKLHNPQKPFEIQRNDGRWILVKERKLPDGSIVSVGTDITELKQAEATLKATHEDLEFRVAHRTSELNKANIELRTNQALLEAVLDNLPDLTGLRDPEGKYVLVNKVFEEWYGLPREEILGKTVDEIWPAETARTFQDRVAEVIEKGDAVHGQMEIGFPDGEVRKIRTVRFPVYLDDQTLLGVGFINTDIGELTKAEGEAIEKSSLLQTILDATPAITALRDTEGRFLFVNRYLQEFFGAPQEACLGKDAAEIFPEREGAVLDTLARKVRESGKPVIGYEWRANDPEKHVFLMTVVPIYGGDGNLAGTLGIGLDISERKRLEEQLQYSQKMEAIGRLTGGVSHDFNNLLGIIIGNLEFLEDMLPADDEGQGREMRRLVSAAIAASEKGANLNRQLLAFSRKQTLAPKSIDLHEQVAGTVDILRRTLGATIDVELLTDDALKRCDADPSQVEAALLNLAINARDAMPRGGKLTIELSNAKPGEVVGRGGNAFGNSSYVVMAVRDTGQGIPAEALDHVFEPFFTTKDVGQGSGLGLSMVFGFAEQSNGHVTIESQEGAGTTVRLYLPCAAGIEQIEGTADTIPRAQGETVLVVEDDSDLQALAVRFLEGLGYTALCASDGKSALEILERESGADVLLTDVILPGGMDGPSVAAAVKQKCPEIKVMFMSGYPRDAFDGDQKLAVGTALLEKPFRKAQLAHKLRQAIDT